MGTKVDPKYANLNKFLIIPDEMITHTICQCIIHLFTHSRKQTKISCLLIYLSY